MSREIACAICKIPLGEVATGSRLRPGIVHICEADARKLAQRAKADEIKRVADDFAKNRRSPPASDFMKDFGKLFGF